MIFSQGNHPINSIIHRRSQNHFTFVLIYSQKVIYETIGAKKTHGRLMGYLCMVYFAHVNFVDFYRQSVGE